MVFLFYTLAQNKESVYGKQPTFKDAKLKFGFCLDLTVSVWHHITNIEPIIVKLLSFTAEASLT